MASNNTYDTFDGIGEIDQDHNPKSTGKGVKVSRWTIYACTFFTIGLTAIVALGVGFAEPSDSCQCQSATEPTIPTTSRQTVPPSKTIPQSTITATPQPTTPTTSATTCPPVPTPDPDEYWQTCLDQSVTRNDCMPGIPDCPDGSNHRLPRRLIPSHYDLEIRPNLYSGDPATFTYQGTVKIDLTCAEVTDTVYLHYRDMTIDDASVNVTDNSNNVIEISGIVRDVSQEFYIIYLSRFLDVDEEIRVSVGYSGYMNHIAKGMSWNRYLDDNSQERYHLSTQLQSTDARRAFPCMDEPELKATFALSIWRRDGYESLFNSELLRTDSSSGDGWNLDVYRSTPRMATYLVAFMVGEFSSLTMTSSNGHRVNTWAPTHWINAGYANYTNQKSHLILDYFDDLFGVRYPLSKLDQSVAVDYTGAMENWGMIFYRTSGLLTHPTWGTLAERRSATGVIGHEIVHQWFGDLVTCRWWEDTWLNEGFAAYYETFPWETVEPEWDIEDYFVTGRLLRALKLDDQGDALPTHDQTVEDAVEVASSFGQQSYSKGACILRMMDELVMLDNWYDVLYEYLTTNQYDSGSDVDFFAALEAVIVREKLQFEVSPVEVMKTYLYQAGSPVVTISRKVGTSVVKITQKRFLRNPYASMEERYPSPYGYKWEVPIEMTSRADSSKTTLTWLHKNDREVDIGTDLGVSTISSGDWVLGNHRAKGYFRTNYDAGNWGALISQLNSNHTVIPKYNRGVLLNDALYLARAEELDITTALQLSEYLVHEKEWVPFDMFSDGLDYLDGMVRTLPDYDLFRMYMRNLWNNTINDLGFEPMTGEENVLSTMYLRRRAVSKSCYYGNTYCVLEAVRLFNAWMAEPDDFTIIPPDVRDHVLCSAIENLQNQEEWDFLFDRYQLFKDNGDFTSMRTNIRAALACSRQTYLLSNLFFMAIEGDPKIHSSDRSSILSAIAANPIGQPIAWDYLNVNWTNAMTIFLAASEKFNTDYDMEVLDKFYEEHKVSSESDQESLDGRRIYIQANIRYMKRNEQNFIDWTQSVTQCLPPCETPEPPVVPPVGSYRLPTTFKPLHYDLEIIPDFYQADPSNNLYTGHVDITLRCEQDSNTVVVHYLSMAIDTVSVIDSNGQPIAVINESGSSQTELYYITLGTTVVQGATIIVSIDHSGSILTDYRGMYVVPYPDPDQGTTRHQLITQFALTNARKTFPCLDEPALKATYNFTLWRKTGYQAVANMPLRSTEDKGNDWFADTFEKFDVPMPPYLLAFSVVEDFGHKDRTSNLGILTRQWTQNRFINAGFADYADNITAPMMDYFSTLYGHVYPLPKEDQITVANHNGGNENWGLIAYGADVLMYDPELSSESEKALVNLFVAHEVNHQWFGNLVTCAWWSDTWVNEASASYYEFWGTGSTEPDWKMDQIMIDDIVWSAMSYDSYGDGHPMHTPADTVNTPSEILGMFSTITYEKGACVLRMMDKLVMNPYWNESLETIVNRYQYTGIDNDDYTSVLDEIATNRGVDLDGVTPSVVMNTWLNQMGYPVVTMTVQSNNGQTDVQLSQSLFLVDSERPIYDQDYPPVNYKWEIPIDYVTNVNASQPERWWLHQTDGQFVIGQEVDWVLGNYYMHGFYRVNYDRNNWDAITAQLNKDHKVIYESNRAQLIEDSFNLARGELLELTVGLELTTHLVNDTEYLPWSAADRTLSYLDKMLTGTSDYLNFQKYMNWLTGTNYNLYGWDERPGDTHFDIYMRTLTLRLACKYGNVDCISQAQMFFNRWKNSPQDNSIVRADIKDTVYCTAMKYSSDIDDWNFLFGRYTYFINQDHFSQVRNRIAIGLTCTRDQALLARFYDMAKRGDSEIHSSDRNSIMYNIARNPVYRSSVWRILDQEWDTHPSRSGVLSVLTEHFNSADHVNQLEQFYHRHPASPDYERRMTINANVRWRNLYWDQLVDWLEM